MEKWCEGTSSLKIQPPSQPFQPQDTAPITTIPTSRYGPHHNHSSFKIQPPSQPIQPSRYSPQTKHSNLKIQPPAHPIHPHKYSTCSTSCPYTCQVKHTPDAMHQGTDSCLSSQVVQTTPSLVISLQRPAYPKGALACFSKHIADLDFFKRRMHKLEV